MFDRWFKPDVKKLERNKDVEGLIKALEFEEDIFVHTDAARALGTIGDSRAVEPLIAAFTIRKNEAAIQALGKISDPRAVEPLIVAIKDTNMRSYVYRQNAAEALGKIGDIRAIEPLIAAINDPDGCVREAAMKALKDIKWIPKNDALSAQYWIYKHDFDKCIPIGAPAVEPLIAVLTNSTRDTYQDREDHERAIKTLGTIGDSRAVEPLIARLNDSGFVSYQAIDALGKIKDNRAIEPLIAMFKNSDRDSSRYAANALIKIGSPAVEPLIAYLMDTKKNGRPNAAETLGAIGDSRAVEPLVTALTDSNVYVRESASEALNKFKWHPPDDELSVYYWISKHDFEKCISFGAPAVEPLIATHSDSRYDVRKNAAQILVTLYNSGRLGPLEKKQILENQSFIQSSHEDRNPFCEAHTDKGGIGISF